MFNEEALDPRVVAALAPHPHVAASHHVLLSAFWMHYLTALALYPPFSGVFLSTKPSNLTSHIHKVSASAAERLHQ